MEKLIIITLGIHLIGLVFLLPFLIQSFVLILKERKKQFFSVCYVIDHKGLTENKVLIVKTKNQFVPYQDNNKILLENITKTIKDRHPFHANVRDIKIVQIDVIGDKVINYEFKI